MEAHRRRARDRHADQKRERHLMVVLGVVSVIAIAVPVWTATNTVASSKASNTSNASTATQLAPAACKGMGLTAVLVGSPNATGGGGAELILGTGAANTLSGGGGRDCIVAGAGNDTLNGGGPGGAAGDYCDGGAGADVMLGCETQVNFP